MLEIPEAQLLACQSREILVGKTIVKVVAVHTPHKFAWYAGDPHEYHRSLDGITVTGAQAYGGMVEIQLDAIRLLFSDGVNLRYHAHEAKRPVKHQLLLEFVDGSGLSASVQMYGGLCCFREGTYENTYYLQAKAKPSPLSTGFDQAYFADIVHKTGAEKLSLKALLATEQRIPGLGNGTLQDILYNAQLHPKKKVRDLAAEDVEDLFHAVKTTLRMMADQGGRDTERDLFGIPGRYHTKLSRNTSGRPCSVCGSVVQKETYLGGSIYYCPGCQKI